MQGVTRCKSPFAVALEGPRQAGRRQGERKGRYCGSHQGTAGPSAVHAACGGPDVRLRGAQQGTGGAHAGVRWGSGAPTARRAGRTGGPSRCPVRGAGDGGRIGGGRAPRPDRRIQAGSARRQGRGIRGGRREPRSMQLGRRHLRSCPLSILRTGSVRARPPLPPCHPAARRMMPVFSHRARDLETVSLPCAMFSVSVL